MTTKVPLVSGGAPALSASTTYFQHAAMGRCTTSVSESDTQLTWRTAGTLSNIAIRLTANDRGASTLRSRVNGANGAQSVSIGASATGYFEDTTNTDAIAAGDEACLSYATGAGGTATTPALCSVHFTANSNTVAKYVASGTTAGTTFSTGSVTRYVVISGASTVQVLEVDVRAKFNRACTLRNFAVNVSANARTSATACVVRKAGANGNQNVSIPATTTGYFEDLVNTDSVVSGNHVNYAFTTGADANSITFRSFSVEAESSDRSWTESVGSSFTASAVDRLLVYGGAHTNPTSASAVTVRTACAVSSLWTYVFSNAQTGITDIHLQKNGSNSGLFVSVPAATTGEFDDGTSVSVLNGDTLNFFIDVAGTGTIGVGQVTTLGEGSVFAASGYGTDVEVGYGAATPLLPTPGSGTNVEVGYGDLVAVRAVDGAAIDVVAGFGFTFPVQASSGDGVLAGVGLGDPTLVGHGSGLGAGAPVGYGTPVIVGAETGRSTVSPVGYGVPTVVSVATGRSLVVAAGYGTASVPVLPKPYEIAGQLLACACEALDETDNGCPDRACVIAGALAWDDCECGQLTVAINSDWASAQFPVPAANTSADFTSGKCGHPLVVYNYTVTILRCVPTGNGKHPPDCADLAESALVSVIDAEAIRKATLCCLLEMYNTRDSLGRRTIEAYQTSTQNYVGPEGMCGGSQQAVTIGFLNDGCCS